MADGYARVTGRVGVCSVHQGPGLTNTITGLTEAAKSRTPVLVLAGDDAGRGADVELPDRPARPGRVGRGDRRPRAQPRDRRRRRAARLPARADRAPAGGADAADRHPAPAGGIRSTRRSHRCPLLEPPRPNAARDRERPRTRSPTRSARRSSPAVARSSPTPATNWRRSARQTGAILATSAPANGLFAGLPYALGISGGFASPFAAELLPAGRRGDHRSAPRSTTGRPSTAR